MDREAMDKKLTHQYESIVTTYGADQPETARLYASLAAYVKRSVFDD
jgi:hypothetical protein